MLSPGKIRSLQRCATPQGIFTILAADHRDSLRAVIAPDAPNQVPAAALTEIKLDIVRHLAPAASAVLLDPIYSAASTGRAALACCARSKSRVTWATPSAAAHRC